MFHIGDSLVKLSLFTFMSQHKSCLFILSFLGSFLNITLTVVESLPFFLKLGLEVKDLLISISLNSVKFFLQTFTILSFLLPFFGEVCSSTLLISDCEFKFLVEEGFVVLKLTDLLSQFLAVLVSAIFLLFHSLVSLLLNLSQVLAVSLFSVRILIIKHLALILKGLLEASLNIFQFLFFLLVLLL